MKKKLCVLISLIVLLVVLCSCSPKVEESIPYSQIKFTEEINPKYIGSYRISRTSFAQKSLEWDEWTRLDIFSKKIVCFGYFTHNDRAILRFSPGYSWEEVEFQGRLCLELRKQ